MDCYNPRIIVPKANTVVLKPWDTGSSCHNMINSNVQTRPDGAFLKFGENVFTDRQGMWGNFMFNAKTPNGMPMETYNNLQGSWARIGPSTYESLHIIGDPYNRWGVGAFLPLPLKSLYDHPNADPKGMWRPDHFKKPFCD